MMKTATVDAPLLAEPAPESLPAVQPPDVALMFERLASNPAVDPEKLERLIAMQERILRHNAKAAFDASFAKMQPKVPEIDERGQIAVKGSVRSTYATLEDIHKVIKPILAEFGFAIRHRTEWPADRSGIIRIVGILSHEQGHSEETAFEAPMDKSEYRTDIQSMGSTVSYGRRYTTLDLLNISTRRADDDGQRSGRPQPPDGLEAWWATLEGVASEGLKAWEGAWEKSKPDFKTYVMNHDRAAYTELKKKAQTVKR